MTTNRQLYVCPQVREVKGELRPRPLWIIREVTTSTEAAPVWGDLSSGNQTLGNMVTDALRLYDEANDAAHLTITSRPVGPGIGIALPFTPVGIDCIGDGNVNLTMPLGEGYHDVWGWATRYDGVFSLDAKDTRFRRAALKWAVASFFNDRRVTSEHIDPHSPLLRLLNSLDKPVEIWIRPTWSASEIFPNELRRVSIERPPVKMPDAVKRQMADLAEKREKQKRQARQQATDDRVVERNAEWAKERAAEAERDRKTAAREAEIRRRVREEMGSH